MIKRTFIKNKKAFLIRVLGKNQVYLALLLLEKGYEVHGTSRDHEVSSFANLLHLGIRDRVKTMWEELLSDEATRELLYADLLCIPSSKNRMKT